MNFLDVCENFPVISIAAGEHLIREGDDGQCLYVLRSGAVSVSKNGVAIARVAQPGALFGEMSALLEVPYTADVTAVSDSEAYEIADPGGFLQSEPGLAMSVARLLARRLYDTNRFIADRHGKTGDDSASLLGLLFQHPQTT